MAAPRCADCGGTDWTKDGRCSTCNSFPTLGFQVADWIEARCAIPDRDDMGKPFLFIDEQLRFLLNFYRLVPQTGRFYYERGGQIVRPQKWGKGPFAAAMICGEAEGPVLFDGWDASGAPVGRPWPTPIIQVTAVSEDQAENIYSALLPMIELGALSGEIEDTSLGRIRLAGGGLIKPVTSAAKSRLGQRITFAAQDQTESWVKTNGGKELAANQRRGLAGTKGRWLSTPNAWDPTEESVAQVTSEIEVPKGGVYQDDVTPPTGLSLRNKKERRRALKIVYGDAMSGTRGEKKGAINSWLDLDRLDTEIVALMDSDPAQAERWFLNRKEAPEAKAFDGDAWGNLARPDLKIADRSLIVLGVDGAWADDALAVIATEVKDPTSDGPAHQWRIVVAERPRGADEDYEHPIDDIDGAVIDAWDRFEVWRMYIDPQWMGPLFDRWVGRYGDKKVIPWHTHRPSQIGQAVRAYTEAINRGDLTHDGDATFTRHIKNAVRKEVNLRDDDGAKLHSISKDRPKSPNKIDAAMAGLISWEARSDAIAANARPKGKGARAIGF